MLNNASLFCTFLIHKSYLTLGHFYLAKSGHYYFGLTFFVMVLKNTCLIDIYMIMKNKIKPKNIFLKKNRRSLGGSSISSIFLILLLVLPACVVNPVSGKRELMLISEKAEIEMGRQIDQDIRKQYGIYNDQALHDYVNGIALNLLPHVHRPNLEYHFAVLDTPVVNAFAAPGGYIYVTRGILALMNSEAELAVVLGHELGHVTARHSVRKMSGLLLLNLGLAVGGLLNEDIAKVAGFASLGIQILFLKFSRDDEYQADALGIEYARKGGYRPREMMSFFTSLQKMTADSGGHKLPNFLSTHPLTENRIKKVEEQIFGADDELSLNRDKYMARIDGLVFGTDPRQGFVEDKTFYHPDLAFSFSIPEGWEVQNTPQQVYLSAAGGGAALVLQVTESNQELAEHLKAKTDSLNQPVYLGEKQASINNLPSLQQYYQVSQENNKLDLEITAIRKDRMIYTFFAVVAEGTFQQHEESIHLAVKSFKPLRDQSKLQRSPLLLKTTKATGQKQMQVIFQENSVPKGLWTNLAVINGRDANEVPAKGTWIKLIR